MALPSIRSSFSLNRSINWFPGHMSKGIKIMETKLKTIDLIVEVRDSRIPLSSINPSLEALVRGSKKLKRLILYNKMDLIPSKYIKPVKDNLKKYCPDEVMFTSTINDNNLKKILNVTRDIVSSDNLKYPYLNVMVVGMPNVGKSSLINALRRIGLNKGKAAKVGAQPGITRSVGSTIKVLEDPNVYLVDTPGVMIPHIPDPITSLKVALTGGIKDHVADEELLVDYLLYVLNTQNLKEYVKSFDIDTDDVHELLEKVGRSTGQLSLGGQVDIVRTCHYILKRFRAGKLGHLVLDDVSELGFKHFYQYLDNKVVEGSSYKVNVSKQEKKKLKIKERLEKIMAKKELMPKPKF